MNAHTDSTRQPRSSDRRALGTAIAVGGFVVVLMLALGPLGTGPASPEHAQPAAPSAHESVGAFAERPGPATAETESHIGQL